MVELAEKTITAPSASRQRVAVSSMLYSVRGGLRPRALLRFLLRLALGGLAAAEAAERRPGRRSRQPLDDLAEALAAAFEVLEGVEAGAGGREQDDLAGRGRGGGAARRRPRGPRSGAARLRPRRPAPAPRRGGRRWRRSGRRRRSARGSGRAAARRARPSRCRRGSRGRRPRRRAMPTAAEATLVAFESLTKRTPPISATCSSRCGDAGEAAQALAHRLAVEPHRERRGGGGHRVGDVVLAEEAELVDRRAAARRRRRSSPRRPRPRSRGRRRRRRRGGGRSRRGRCRPAPGRRRCRRRRRRCPGWRRSAASPPGRTRGRRGGRGGRARG